MSFWDPQLLTVHYFGVPKQTRFRRSQYFPKILGGVKILGKYWDLFGNNYRVGIKAWKPEGSFIRKGGG